MIVNKHWVTYVLQRVDSLSCLLDLTTNDLRDELGCELGERATDSLMLHNVGHLLPDSADLRRARVCGFLDLVGASLRERNGEQTDEIIIGRLHSDVGLDESLPLAHKGTELVGGEVQSVEVGQTVFALHLVDTQLDLAESVVFVVLKIGERDFENSAFQRVVGVFQTGGAVDKGLPHTFHTVSNKTLIHGPSKRKVSCPLSS